MRPDAILIAIAFAVFLGTVAYVSVYHPRSTGRAVGR